MEKIRRKFLEALKAQNTSEIDVYKRQGQRVTLCSKVKYFKYAAAAKASFN